ncbi:G2/M phase-specific E3 ubiquitin-protein ligase-like [Gymnodraco acuticeps]|uniref:G2/M phase-specific E3 ubiquitin-protein ligase-like n=1 Tax=Gymnodraco acuticeps TaxID=8218 RepID=A0A6P8TP50_GYMAC|nr:G2/M phase-specific E3 ubiquitin-protein ligase-like [Gymnodraco acuticeps]
MNRTSVARFQINIGIMSLQKNIMKPVRGKTLPLILDPDTDAAGLHGLAVKKMTDFNSDMDEGPYVLIYPDTSEVINIPGTSTPFNLREYKMEIGKTYNRIALFICLESDYDKGEQQDASDSDREVFVRRNRGTEVDLADTLVCVCPWEPEHESTPKSTAEKTRASYQSEKEEILISDTDDPNEGTSQSWRNTATSVPDTPSNMTAVRSTVNPLYSTYTQLYAPIAIDEDEDGSQDFNVVPISADPAKEAVDTSISAAHIIENLADAIDHNTVSRFNITRTNVWDGAVRGFRRSTFCEKSDLLVRFTDDAGSVEEGIDAGGPRREFLTLLMSFLQSRPIFEGPPQSRYLVYNAAAIREDEYFMAGKMIAVSIVHGGPGPHFLSRDLVNHIAGQPGFCAHVTDVTDDEIGRALSEIELAHSLKSLQDVLLKHSSMLQTAGCFRHVSSVEEKHTVVAEYLTWYTIGRNHSVIERFKDGLASLNFLDALCQHPSVLAPVLCHTDKRLTSVEVERLFLPQLSPAGSNRRTTETVALSFWADYLMDCEEQGPVSLEELFMFITGLKTEPPAGMTPHPCVTFSQETIYPMANTCANTITLPLLGTYASFKANMDFGIQNSPAFGCL